MVNIDFDIKLPFPRNSATYRLISSLPRHRTNGVISVTPLPLYPRGNRFSIHWKR
jgi:hypothetical protein